MDAQHPSSRQESFWLDTARSAVEAERRKGLVAAYARKFGTDGLEDLVQEIVVVALEYERHNVILQPTAFARRVAFRKARIVIERSDRFLNPDEVDAPDPALLADDELARRQRSTALATAVSSLPHKSREIVDAHYGRGYTVKEIVDELQLCEGTTKQRLKASLNQLRDALRRQVFQGRRFGNRMEIVAALKASLVALLMLRPRFRSAVSAATKFAGNGWIVAASLGGAVAALVAISSANRAPSPSPSFETATPSLQSPELLAPPADQSAFALTPGVGELTISTKTHRRKVKPPSTAATTSLQPPAQDDAAESPLTPITSATAKEAFRNEERANVLISARKRKNAGDAAGARSQLEMAKSLFLGSAFEERWKKDLESIPAIQPRGPVQ
jgi:RNA polymerase sigma-70 factor (ECF subfamily)